MIGGASVMRGLPFITNWAARQLPEHGGEVENKTGIALALAGQRVMGVILGVAVEAIILLFGLKWMFDWADWSFVGMMQLLAEQGYPLHFYQWIGLIPPH